MSPYTCALDYVEHGYNVIPTLRDTKRPPFSWKEYQLRRPTEDEIRSWWPAHPEWNLAVVCGTANRVVVVDADNRDAMLFCKLSLPPTPFRVRTAKGMHFYYRHPGTYVQTRTRVHPSLPIDIRADGGLATGLGSIHATGSKYLLDDSADLVSATDLPIFDLTWFPDTRSDRPAMAIGRLSEGSERGRRYLARVDGVGSGLRNQTAFKLAATLTRDFAIGKDEALILLEEWNQRNDPPLQYVELRVIVESSYKTGRNPIGNRIH